MRILGPRDVDRELRTDLAHAVAPLGRQNSYTFIADQVAIGELRANIDRTTPISNDLSFRTNEDFWANVIGENIRANSVVELRNFILTECIPRSPGTFHTPNARVAREHAWHHRMSEEVLDSIRDDDACAMISQTRITEASWRDRYPRSRYFLDRMGKVAKAIGSVAAPLATVVAALLKFYSDS
jgi:hypothetical protein